MNIAGMGAVYSAMYQHTAKVQNTATDKTSFSNQLQNAGSVGKTEVEAYTDYLKSKYGNVSIQSIGKDQASLDRVGRGMSGSDVIIAPNILEQMATDSDKAAFYENKIDEYFNTIIPRNVRLSEAPSHGQPICLYDPTCIGAKSYQKLAEEVIRRG